MPSPQRISVTVHGLRLTYATAGGGPPVVLLHGILTALLDILMALEPAMSSEFQLFAFDRPGCGGSERGRVTGSAWRQAGSSGERSICSVSTGRCSQAIPSGPWSP